MQLSGSCLVYSVITTTYVQVAWAQTSLLNIDPNSKNSSIMYELDLVQPPLNHVYSGMLIKAAN